MITGGPTTPVYIGPRVAPRTPASWDDRPYERFTLEPVSPTIGAVVHGVSMSEVPDEELFAELNRALLEWKVLFWRDQHITAQQHADFARRWGPLESHPFAQAKGFETPEDAPEVVRMEKGPDAKGYENLWHSDVSWRECPSLGSVLRALEVPGVGGDTLWADMGAAYDLLPDDVKDRIDGLVAVHDWFDSFGARLGPEARDALRPSFPAQHHPVVRTHPETGRRTLYVNVAFTRGIVGMDEPESTELLRYLYAQATHPEVQCRFRWQPGSVAFWDNRSTQHYASSDYHPHRRVMERITIAGDRPF